MTIGQRIKEVRKSAGFTQRELAEKSGTATGTIQQYERGIRQPRIEQLQAIAVALGVSVSDLLGQGKEDKPARPWGLFLTEKLASVGCSIGIYEEDAYIWINFPDGTLEVTEAELEELDKSTDSFLRFKLQELIARHPGSFRKQKRRQNTADVISTPPQGTDAPAAGPCLESTENGE